jgi:hypothetical protein
MERKQKKKTKDQWTRKIPCDSSPAYFQPLTLHGAVAFGEWHGTASHLHRLALRQQLVQLVVALERMVPYQPSGGASILIIALDTDELVTLKHKN